MDWALENLDVKRAERRRRANRKTEKELPVEQGIKQSVVGPVDPPPLLLESIWQWDWPLQAAFPKILMLVGFQLGLVYEGHWWKIGGREKRRNQDFLSSAVVSLIVAVPLFRLRLLLDKPFMTLASAGSLKPMGTSSSLCSSSQGWYRVSAVAHLWFSHFLLFSSFVT